MSQPPHAFREFSPHQTTLSAAELNRMLATLREIANLSFDTRYFVRQGNAITMRQIQTSTAQPWTVTRADVGATKKIFVHLGGVDGLIPTNIFSALTIAGTGTEYVVLTISMTANAPTSCVLSISGSAPASSAVTASAPPASVSDVIAVLADGVPHQVRSRNLTVVSQEVLQVPVTNPGIGERNFTPWYRWAVLEAS